MLQNMLHFMREFLTTDPLFFIIVFVAVSCLVSCLITAKKASQGKKLSEEEKRVVRANLRDWKL